jgi:hypothetical protein
MPDALSFLFSGFRARAARRIAIETVSSRIEASRHRLGSIPEATWSDPYVVGFVMMLVTMVARAEHPAITRDALSHLQAEAWTAVTGTGTGWIGEQVMALSATRDPGFENGCRNGERFAALIAALAAADGTDPDRVDFAGAERQAWADMFECHVVNHFVSAIG